MKKSISVPFIFLMITIFLSMAGCSGHGSSSPPPPAPTILSTTPLNGSVGVAITDTITVTFSEAMDQATINESTFIVKDSGNNAVTGTVSYNSGTTATFTPTNSLDYLTKYTATITTGVKNTTGQALAANYSWSFTAITTPSPLLSAATLKTWIDNGTVNGTGNNRVVILDITSSGTFSTGHIPGAFFVNGTGAISETRKEGPAKDVTMVPTGATMDALIQQYGIDGNTTIVFTTGGTPGANAILSATRSYFTFRYWGFPKEKLKVLDGVNFAYAAAGYPMATGSSSPTVTPSAYSVKQNPSLMTELRSSLSDMITAASTTDSFVVDMRSGPTGSNSYAGWPGSTTGVFNPTGASGDYVVFEGHIKGAQALNFASLFNAGDNYRFNSTTALQTAFNNIGVDGTKKTHVY